MLGALLLGVACPGASRRASAQQGLPPPAFAVSRWTVAGGLPQSSVLGLARDIDGYLWIGTSAGLARFDGDSFVTHPALQATAVIALTTDRHGDVWVGLRSAEIRHLDRRGALLPSLERAPVTPSRLAVSSPDSIWIANADQVWLHTPAGWGRASRAITRRLGAVRALAADSTGAVWIGGNGGAVLLQASGRAIHLASLPCPSVSAIEPDGRGGAWLGTCAGFVHATGSGRVEMVAGAARRGPDTVLALRRAEGDALWIGRRGEIALARVRRSTRGWRLGTLYTNSQVLQGTVPSVLTTASDGLWVGTGGVGLVYLRHQRAMRLTLENGLPDRAVHNIVPDGQGGLLMSGGCNGVSRWRNGAVLRESRAAMLAACVSGLLRDRSGALWMGGMNGIARLGPDSTRKVVVGPLEGLREHAVPLLEDRAGRIWFGSTKGELGHARGREVTLFPPGTLRPGQVWSLHEGDAGFWVGQVGELTLVDADGAVLRRLGPADGVPAAPLRALALDEQGAVWMASYGAGIARWREGEGIRPLLLSGPAQAAMQSSIDVDATGRFWFLNDAGILIAPKAALDSAVDSGTPLTGATWLGEDEGVPEGNGGYPNTWMDAARALLWVATVDGVSIVETRSSAPEVNRAVRLEQVRIDGQALPLRDSVAVPAEARSLELRFSTPWFGRPRGLAFRYRLGGYDRDWIEAGRTRAVRYTNLGPGTYRFEVANVAGQAQERVLLTVPVRVEASWWEHWLARLALVLVALAIPWLTARWGTRRVRARAQALQYEIAERRRAEELAATAARDLAHVSRVATAGELATSMAHELNQPLTAIVGSTETVRRLLEESDGEVRELLDDIVSQSKRAASVLRTLRDFVNRHRVVAATARIDQVLDGTLQLMRPELRARQVRVEVRNSLPDGLALRADGVQLQQVLVNLLLNAADAMRDVPPAQRFITITAAEDGEAAIRLTIADQGTGIASGDLDRIFRPFLSTKHNGLGLGLALSRTIIEAHAGILWAESPPGEGASFYVVLPRQRFAAGPSSAVQVPPGYF